MEKQAPFLVSTRQGLEIFRVLRARLIARGISQAAAEIYAKDVVWRCRALVFSGQVEKAAALQTEEHADDIAALHFGAIERASAASDGSKARERRYVIKNAKRRREVWRDWYHRNRERLAQGASE